MKPELKSKVARYYSEKIKTFGAMAKGVDWKDEQSQNLRFEQLVKIFGNERNISLNDLGCGYGAFFLYRDMPRRLSRYYGYDISEAMLTSARALVRNDRAVFIKSDRITMEADYSIASGVFNVRLDTETKLWEEFILKALANMDKKSLKGFAFNCMTTYVNHRVAHLYYGDPSFFFDFCKRNFSKYVTLIHDYELYEWTMLIKKEI